MEGVINNGNRKRPRLSRYLYLTIYAQSLDLGHSLYLCLYAFKFSLYLLTFCPNRTLKIYGPSDKRSQLEPALVWATPGQRGFNNCNSSRKASTRPSTSASVALPPSMLQTNSGQVAAQTEATRKQQEALYKAAELRQMISALEKVDDEGRRASLLDTLFSTEDILSLPEHPNPPGIATGELTVDLLKHQVYISIYTLPVPYHEFSAKRLNGAFNVKTPSSRRQKVINQCNSGNSGRGDSRCVKLNFSLHLSISSLFSRIITTVNCFLWYYTI